MKTNSRKFKNVKITRNIIAIWFISLLTTIIIGGVGYYNANKMYTVINEMNTDIVPKLKAWGDINGNIGIMRNSLTKIIDRPFDQVNEKSILDMNDKVTEIMNEQISQSKSDKKEEELVNTAKAAYDHYYSYIPQVIELRKQGLVPDVKMTNVDMANYGNELTKSITDLVDYEKSVADLKDQESVKLYRNNMIIFGIIFVLSLLILSGISLTVTIAIKNLIKEFTGKLQVLSKGDFTVEIDTSLTNEFGVMNNALKKTIISISDILKNIEEESSAISNQATSLSTLSEQMHNSTKEISSAVDAVAQGSSDQAVEIVTMSNLLNSFGTMLDDITSTISGVDKNTNDVNIKAKSSNEQLSHLIESISYISKSFIEVSKKISNLGNSVQEITDITDFLNAIADQTNLLALNAAIEAARAGEAGKGFAVVADEIRKLAEQSKDSSNNINELLKSIQDETNIVTKTTDETNEELSKQVSIIDASINSFKEIITAIGDILPQISEINNSILEINKNKNNIISVAENTSVVAEENSASAEEISATTQDMINSSNEVDKSSQLLRDKTAIMINKIKKFTL